MFCRPVILCLLNCITETIQMTEGRMLASPYINRISNKLFSSNCWCSILWAEDFLVHLANMLHHVVGIIVYRAIAKKENERRYQEAWFASATSSGCSYRNYTTWRNLCRWILGAFTKLRKAIMSFIVSAWRHGTNRIPLFVIKSD